MAKVTKGFKGKSKEEVLAIVNEYFEEDEVEKKDEDEPKPTPEVIPEVIPEVPTEPKKELKPKEKEVVIPVNEPKKTVVTPKADKKELNEIETLKNEINLLKEKVNRHPAFGVTGNPLPQESGAEEHSVHNMVNNHNNG